MSEVSDAFGLDDLGVECSVDFGDDDDCLFSGDVTGAAEYVSDFLTGCCGDDVAFSSGSLSRYSYECAVFWIAACRQV